MLIIGNCESLKEIKLFQFNIQNTWKFKNNKNNKKVNGPFSINHKKMRENSWIEY